MATAVRGPADRLGRIDRSVAGPYLAVLAGSLLVLPGFWWHLTPDGISYLSVADHWVAGRYDAAVNGYWSPLFSWLIAPLRLVGIPGALAAKLVTVPAALGVLAVVRHLSRRLQAGPKAVTWISWAMVAPLVAAAFVFVTPDLLVVVPVLLAVDRAVALLDAPGWRDGLLLGLWCGLAYLTKLFALPWAAVLLVLLAGWLVVRRGPRAALTSVLPALLVAGVLVGSWTAALSATYDRVTVGTAAEENVRYLDPDGSRGAAIGWAGLLPPPHEGSVSAWEDLPYVVEQVDLDGRIAEDAGSAEGVGPPALLAQAGRQLWTLVVDAAWWLPLIGVAAATPRLVRQRRGRTGPRHPVADDPWPALLVAVAAAVWVGGVLLTFVATRYLWAPLFLLAPLAAVGIDALARSRPRSDAAAGLGLLLVGGLLPYAAVEIADEWGTSRSVNTVANELEEQVDLTDARVASVGQWAATVGVCYVLECRHHGIPADRNDLDAVMAEAREADLDYVLIVGMPPAAIEPDEVVARVDEVQLTVLEVR